MSKKEDLIGKTFSLLIVVGEPTESHADYNILNKEYLKERIFNEI